MQQTRNVNLKIWVKELGREDNKTLFENLRKIMAVRSQSFPDIMVVISEAASDWNFCTMLVIW